MKHIAYAVASEGGTGDAVALNRSILHTTTFDNGKVDILRPIFGNHLAYELILESQLRNAGAQTGRFTLVREIGPINCAQITIERNISPNTSPESLTN